MLAMHSHGSKVKIFIIGGVMHRHLAQGRIPSCLRPQHIGSLQFLYLYTSQPHGHTRASALGRETNGCVLERRAVTLRILVVDIINDTAAPAGSQKVERVEIAVGSS